MTKQPTVPRKYPPQLNIKTPPDISELLTRLSFETGRAKRDLVLDAIRKVYGEQEK